jgi:hypothetical protein
MHPFPSHLKAKSLPNNPNNQYMLHAKGSAVHHGLNMQPSDFATHRRY